MGVIDDTMYHRVQQRRDARRSWLAGKDTSISTNRDNLLQDRAGLDYIWFVEQGALDAVVSGPTFLLVQGVIEDTRHSSVVETSSFVDIGIYEFPVFPHQCRQSAIVGNEERVVGALPVVSEEPAPIFM